MSENHLFIGGVWHGQMQRVMSPGSPVWRVPVRKQMPTRDPEKYGPEDPESLDDFVAHTYVRREAKLRGEQSLVVYVLEGMGADEALDLLRPLVPIRWLPLELSG